MIAAVIVAAVVTGIIAGWWLTVTIAAAAMSRSQSRMLRKLTYWQVEASRARAEADQLAEAARQQVTLLGRSE
jgi:hypothetical protein